MKVIRTVLLMCILQTGCASMEVTTFVEVSGDTPFTAYLAEQAIKAHQTLSCNNPEKEQRQAKAEKRTTREGFERTSLYVRHDCSYN